MSETTTNLRLPYIMPAQAQKHVTHNEALRRLDALVQLSVVSRTLNAPPTEPAEGVAYIVPQGAEPNWGEDAGRIVSFQDGQGFGQILAPNHDGPVIAA